MKAVTDTKYYDEIAKALVDEAALQLSYLPSEMAAGLRSVCQYKYGVGYNDGYAIGESQGIQLGIKAQYDEFWDTIQNNGARTNYSRYFSSALWTDDYLKIKYDMVASTMYQCFRENSSVTALDKKRDGSTLIIDGSSISTSTGFNNVFYNCTALVYVGTIISRADAPWDNAFRACNNLQEITFEGTIGKDFDIHWSTKLSAVSLWSILTACNKEAALVTITLPANCIDGKTDTENYIANDTELNTALTNARWNGYTVVFN